MNRALKPRPLIRFGYVIGPQQGMQKVGIATDPQARFAALQTASPFELFVHAAVAVPFREAHAAPRTLAAGPHSGPSRLVRDLAVPGACDAGGRSCGDLAGTVTLAVSRAQPAAVFQADPVPLMRLGPPATPPISQATSLPLFDFQPKEPGFAPETPIAAPGGYRMASAAATGRHHTRWGPRGEVMTGSATQ